MLGLRVNLQSQVLTSRTTQIPFSYRTNFDIQKIEVPPESIVSKEIRTSVTEGTEILIDDITFGENLLQVPSCITRVENQSVRIEIQNHTKQSQLMIIDFDFVKEFGNLFDNNEFECFHVENRQPASNNSNPVSFQNLRTDHLNSEKNKH
ncbi:hypothetical protein Trydic_g11167 [Trypoxylus dichotomus]